jgi:AraC family transcriptional regulator
LFEQEWVSQKYNNKNTSLGYALDMIANKFENLNEGNLKINKELFYSIGECVVEDQSIVFTNFSQLKAVKEETNGRLFNYVHEAKSYIDNYFLEKTNLQFIAREAKLSEYHFIRLFKTIFNTAPYQYI